MATRLEKHRARQEALSKLGKELTRRAGSKCELCDAAGVTLRPYEVAPVPTEPRLEQCLFICETCMDQLNHPKRVDPNHWRCLSRTIWSELPVIQVVSILMLRQLEPLDWASELLEQAYLPEDVQHWLATIS